MPMSWQAGAVIQWAQGRQLTAAYADQSAHASSHGGPGSL